MLMAKLVNYAGGHISACQQYSFILVFILVGVAGLKYNARMKCLVLRLDIKFSTSLHDKFLINIL